MSPRVSWGQKPRSQNVGRVCSASTGLYYHWNVRELLQGHEGNAGSSKVVIPKYYHPWETVSMVLNNRSSICSSQFLKTLPLAFAYLAYKVLHLSLMRRQILDWLSILIMPPQRLIRRPSGMLETLEPLESSRWGCSRLLEAFISVGSGAAFLLLVSLSFKTCFMGLRSMKTKT